MIVATLARCLVLLFGLAVSASAGLAQSESGIPGVVSGADPIFSFINTGSFEQRTNGGLVDVDQPKAFACLYTLVCRVEADQRVLLSGNNTPNNRYYVVTYVDGIPMDQPTAPFLGTLPTDGSIAIASFIQSKSQLFPTVTGMYRNPDNPNQGVYTVQTKVYTDYPATIQTYSIVYRIYRQKNDVRQR